ncbi:ABC transporter ATP-binding protein [Pseudaminobacter soli (ex Li et al. 2025)]|uniref:ABC transporter ATP-binding protein n=1 Tax=Pseudaminobacter soli (ex Li et al. 2025) TaxID=1295366 RepID=A0A2P7RVX7_9HYPH|nr:ABC transporter ATP-binding protein [Mesorhizobium soli]PSJ54363.1 ABC transporter ATP-binding protein [Mesorhizobium soli]
MNEPLVLASDICRSFPNGKNAVLPVLTDIDCRVGTGDRVALVGVSGSGKTTLLHILGGLDEPTSGSISWPALGAREELRPGKVAFVFQTPSLFPALTVVQNVALPLLLMDKQNDATTKAREILAKFELLDLCEKLPEELSGGQAQRVAMARALVTGARLILADEPTGQLDSSTATHLLDLVLNIMDGSDTALVIATHDETVAARLNTRWSIDAGQLRHDVMPTRKSA